MAQFTVTVLSPATETKTLRLSVRIPEEAAPLVVNDDGQEVRDHGNADWPDEREIASEVGRVAPTPGPTQRVWVVSWVGEGDDLLEAIYEARLADTGEIADQVGYEWGQQMLAERPSLSDWQLGEEQHIDALELCDHTALFDALRSNGAALGVASNRRQLVTRMCRVAYRTVIETLEAEADAESDEDDFEDDGQPTDLQEHEDFAQDGDAPTYID